MHGHGLLQLAEQEHIDEWTDFAASAVYGALKRLAAEGLVVEDRIEKQGNYPNRQIYRISELGASSLDLLRSNGLSEIVVKPDPFDLALARLDPDRLDELPAVLGDRLAQLQHTLHAEESHFAEIIHYLTPAETWSMTHKFFRLRGEITYHEALITALPAIIANEKSQKETN